LPLVTMRLGWLASWASVLFSLLHIASVSAGRACLKMADLKCVRCPPGSYPSSHKCLDCIPGHYCATGAHAPVPCPKGKYSTVGNQTGEKSCERCMQGTYGLKEGASSKIDACKVCPPLTWTSAEASSRETDCQLSWIGYGIAIVATGAVLACALIPILRKRSKCGKFCGWICYDPKLNKPKVSPLDNAEAIPPPPPPKP
jgi:hypothetical protein